MTEILAPGGALAAAIPHFEDRPEQRRMAAAITRALDEARPLLVEAGTGTGKTLAYLVAALESGRRVVVSTGTRALQDQIVRHDLPLVRQILGRPFTAATVKGVSNYLCRRKLDELRATRTRSSADLDAILAWADHTTSGDRAELDLLGEGDPVWADVTTTTEARLGPRCPYFERCFVTIARRAAAEADLILVNHHLYFADLALRTVHPGAKVLPDHDAVIFDEAHQLEDIATDHFGLRVSSARIGGLVREARAVLSADLFTSGHDAQLGEVDRSSTTFFGEARRALSALGGDAGRVVLPPEFFTGGALRDGWFALDTAQIGRAHV